MRALRERGNPLQADGCDAEKFGECGLTRSNSNREYFRWWSPIEFFELAGSHRIELGERAMFKEGQNFRDAHVAARFALFRGAHKVRLLEPRAGQTTPDLAMLFDDHELRFEITEADRPGRKRGDEYRNGSLSESVRSLTDEEWTDAETYLAVVRNLVLKKAAKRYDNCQGLIVWSNAFGISDEEVITPERWSEACEPGRISFSEIWVHHRDAFCRVLPS